MPLRLTIVQAPHTPRRETAWEDAEILHLGRGADCEVLIDSSQLSRKHARLVHTSAGWHIEDNGSTNGIAVNGLRVQRWALSEPTEVWLGRDVVLQIEPIAADRLQREEVQRATAWRQQLSTVRFDDTASIPDLLTRLLRSCRNVSGATRGFVMLGTSPDDLELVATSGIAPERVSETTFTGSSSAVRRALERGEPVVSADAASDTKLARQHSIARGGIRCLACLPLLLDSGGVGVVYLDSQEPGKVFDSHDLELLESIASHALLALEVVRLREELNRVRKISAQVAEAPAADRGPGTKVEVESP